MGLVVAWEVGVLGRVADQGSLLATGLYRGHLVTAGSFYERLARHGHEVVRDEDFARLYAPRYGRPSIPPSVMVRALLCATHDRTSDAETSRRTRVDLDWKAAMGVDDDFAGIAATTFSLFRARLVVHDADRSLFEATVAKAVQTGVLAGSLTAIVDSSPVRGAGAVADTYELLRGLLVKVARAGRDRVDAGLAARVEELAAGKPRLDWQDPAARKTHLAELVGVARRVLADVEGCAEAAVAEPAGLLGKVVADDTEPDPDDPDGGVRIRDGVARDRVVSHSDPQMRHGRKSASRRFDGHKMHVLSDEGSELVLGVAVGAGNGGDGEAAAPLLAAVQRSLATAGGPADPAPDPSADVTADAAAAGAVDVGTLLADMAYSDGDTRVAVEEAGAALVAKVPPVSNAGRLPKTEFTVAFDTDDQAVGITCPAGQRTSDRSQVRDHKGRPAQRFTFPAEVCAQCPLRDRCVKAAGGRSITVGMHEARIARARAAQTEPATAELLRRRAKVERKIDHLQDLGLRQARYRGRRNTLLQATLAATVANFSRLCVLDVFQAATPTALAA